MSWLLERSERALISVQQVASITRLRGYTDVHLLGNLMYDAYCRHGALDTFDAL
jgi:hypothetical protein